ncbi:MAG: hypothetical protein HZA78_02335 [Candidatus Schekmanbacteria bacterium]|nr:hypothetical protein [Candidatus Schekmanbacteria bacterium]
MNGKITPRFWLRVCKVYYAVRVRLIMPDKFWLTKSLFAGLMGIKYFSTAYCISDERRI